MRENGEALAKRARAMSWWGLVHRRSTKATAGVQTSADLSAQAVGRGREGGTAEGGGGEEAAEGGGSAAALETSGAGTGAVEGSGWAALEPPQATRRRRRVR